MPGYQVPQKLGIIWLKVVLECIRYKRHSFFFKTFFRLSESNKQRLEIGSGSLELDLDEDLEDRISFWSKIWTELNPVKLVKASESWRNPKAYRRDQSEPQDMKTEL